MPKFNVKHKSSQSAKDAYSAIKKFLGDDKDLKKLDAKLECSFDDSAMSCKMTGSQFKAHFTIAAPSNGDHGSTVTVTVDLPLLLTPFKGKVTETLQKKLAKYLA